MHVFSMSRMPKWRDRGLQYLLSTTEPRPLTLSLPTPLTTCFPLPPPKTPVRHPTPTLSLQLWQTTKKYAIDNGLDR